MEEKKMQKYLLLLFITLGLIQCVVSNDGFCSMPSEYKKTQDSNSQPLYWKVTNPTLAPVHLQDDIQAPCQNSGGSNLFLSNDIVNAAKFSRRVDGGLSRVLKQKDLPGFTRSVYKRDHALITPESHVFSPLPEWINTLGAYLITPEMGSHFVMYIAKMQAHSESANPLRTVERFLFVIQGDVTLTNSSGINHRLLVDSYAYLPANSEHSVKCDTSATLIVFERRYACLENQIPEQIVGSTDMQPLLETPGEVFELRKLLPASAPYDFNIHIMDFQPGEFLNVKEVHYNQHGLLLLEGQGIYRLGDNWYPVQAGDAIWMAPFVPQWYAALGKTRSRYLLYKDVNRNPLQ